MGRVIYDFAEALESKKLHEEAARIRQQVRDAVGEHQLKMAEERGRAEERETWRTRLGRWSILALAGTVVSFLAGFLSGLFSR